MSKATKRRLDKLEDLQNSIFARRVWKLKGVNNPSQEQIKYVVELSKPENLAAYITAGLELRLEELSKVGESR